MSTRIGVDVGGTFTDVIAYDDETGAVTTAKVPTTPSAPERGVLAGVLEGIDEPLADVTYFLHGTTVGLNTLLTRTGATVGLLTTAGFRDILELRRGDRGDPYNLFWQPPEPLVPRRLRLEVPERVTFRGEVLVPLDEAAVRTAAATFAAEGVDAVVIAFLHAYANPEHELAAADALRAAGFAGELSLSHHASGEYREYERTSTSVIDAYVRPRVRTYLQRLSDGLATEGFAGHELLMRSGGGAMTFVEAAERSFETIMSGPVAGAQGAAALAARHGVARLVTADVGGTSFDTCLIRDGQLPVLYEGSIEGMAIQAPWVDVRSIGAGGGSLVRVDEGGLLRVGPQSAGAEPGPACYGRGGTQATTTDAAALLGMLAGGELAGGLQLDLDRARAAYAPEADALGRTVEETARGALQIAAASMASAIREITVEQGEDPRECALVPFGGAGPLFATLIAEELGMTTMLIPAHAGNFSALGLVGADVRQAASRSITPSGGAEGLATAGEVAAGLLAGLGDGDDGDETVVGLDVRYKGQEHFLTVVVPWADGAIAVDVDGLRARFVEAYGRTFGDPINGPFEIVSVRCERRTHLGGAAAQPPAPGTGGTGGSARAWSFERDDWADFALVDRGTLAVDARVAGPAILLEDTTTIYLDAGWEASVLADGTLRVDADKPGEAPR